MLFIVMMLVSCDNSGEEDGDEEANHDKQIGQGENLLVLVVSFEVLLDGISRLGQDMHEGHIDKECSCEGGTHRFQKDISFEGDQAKRQGTYKHDDGHEEHNEDEFQNDKDG